MSREAKAAVSATSVGAVLLAFVVAGLLLVTPDAASQVPQREARTKYVLDIAGSGTETDTFPIPIGARTLQVCLDSGFDGTSVTFKSKGLIDDTMVELLDSSGAAVALTVAASKCVSADGETVNVLSGDWLSLVVSSQTGSTTVVVTIRS